MRILGNRALVRPFVVKPPSDAIQLPEKLQTSTPVAVVLLLGEGRSGKDYRTKHARHLLSELQPGYIVRINTQMGSQDCLYQNQQCKIVSTLDIQAIYQT